MSYTEAGGVGKGERSLDVSFGLAGWTEKLQKLGFTVKEITEYPVELRGAQEKILPNKRPFELSGLSERIDFGTVLDAEVDNFRIILSPPKKDTIMFAANVFDPSGKLIMSNHDYSISEFFDGLRRNVPSLAGLIPDDPAALFKNTFSR